MIYMRLDYVLGVLLLVLLIVYAPISSIFADEIERKAQLGYCCYIADPRENYDACEYDPLPGQTHNQECCDDWTNHCVGDVSIWNMDYTYVWRVSCPRLAAPCAWTDPALDDAIYQNASGQIISRRGYMCVRQPDPWNCTHEPPLGCGPKTTWANYEYQTCTSDECDDKYCD